MRKIVITLLSAALLVVFVLSSCLREDNSEIYAVSREEGSGTRSAFSKIFGVLDSDGIDAVTGRAEKVTSTATVLSTVSGNKNAIGYMSYSVVNDSVKVIDIDGIEPNIKNIQGGSYKASRPFNICYIEERISDVSMDFISYINSTEGEKIILDEGYIPSVTGGDYLNRHVSGRIIIAGSTSVSPVIERLADSYKKINPNVQIEVQQSGSGAGIQSTIAGVSDIGISSRDLKPRELESLKVKKIADDGIVVVVNKNNKISNLTSQAVREIYLGNVRDWSEVNGRYDK